jgi:acetylornithine deacetylase
MQQISELMDAAAPDIVQLCADLVRLNTVNPYSGDGAPAGERAGQDFLRPLLERLGASVVLFDCPPDIYDRTGILGPRERDFSGRPNLVATWDFGGDGPTLVLNGHMDTVGIDHMPGALDPRLEDGCLHGRGTSDCKGGLTVAVSAIETFLRACDRRRGRLIFQSVVDEECNGGGAGTLACLDAGYTGDVAIFVDGNNDTLTLGCGGCLTADLFVAGQEGHAALGTGVSAIEKGLIVKQGVDEFKRQREAARPHCKVNLGIFRAGVHPAVVPGAAYLSLNTVYEYQEAVASRDRGGPYGGPEIRAYFEQTLRQAESADPWLREHPSRLEWVKDLIPYDQPADDPWVSRFEEAFMEARGVPPTRDRMIAWSDAAHPAALFHIPTILYGPGVEGTAHTSHEYVTVEALVNCTKVLATFLARELSA